MKINQKDLLAGLLLMAFAVAGLWLNMDHTLGTARRMGPGYMPLLALGLLLFLSVMITAMSLTNGPDPLERWAWRELFLILAAICVFGLILEKAGLVTSLVVMITISSFADRTHKPLGVFGLMMFLIALCWLVFIYWLDIRIPVWPTFLGN